jgi:hypothetical protein
VTIVKKERKDMRKTYYHGEVQIFKADKLPKELKKVKLFKEDCYKLADSEITSNFHLLQNKEGVELFEDSNGVLWLKNEVPCDVFCAIEARHDNITLEPGVWEIDRAQEFDYMTDLTRKVAD